MVKLKDSFLVALGEQVAVLGLLVSVWWIASTTALTSENLDYFFKNGWRMMPKTECGNIDYQTVLFWNIIQISTFWGLSIFFTLIDQYNEKTKQLSKRKIYNPGRRMIKKIPWDMVRLANYESFKNSVVSYIVQLLLYLPLYEWRGNCDSMWFESINTPYDWIILLIKISLLTFVADFIFYVGHRMFHESKYLYQNFHKLHHQWVDTFAVVATAAHPFEHFASNLATVLGTPLVLGLPYGFSSLFVVLALISTCLQHSGYGIAIKFNFSYLRSFWKKSSDNNNTNPSEAIRTNKTSQTNPIDDNSDDSDTDNKDTSDDEDDSDGTEEEEDIIIDYSKFYDFHHDFHHHFQTAEYGSGQFCDKFFKTRMKDQFPKAWKQIVMNAYDNGYICVGVTNKDLIELIKQRKKEKQMKRKVNNNNNPINGQNDYFSKDDDNDNDNDKKDSFCDDWKDDKKGGENDSLLDKNKNSNTKNTTKPRRRRRKKK